MSVWQQGHRQGVTGRQGSCSPTTLRLQLNRAFPDNAYYHLVIYSPLSQMNQNTCLCWRTAFCKAWGFAVQMLCVIAYKAYVGNIYLFFYNTTIYFPRFSWLNTLLTGVCSAFLNKMPLEEKEKILKSWRLKGNF